MNLLIVDDEYIIVQSILRDLDFEALGITSVSRRSLPKSASISCSPTWKCPAIPACT